MPWYFPDFQRHNPFRLTSWRWERAANLHATGRRSSPRHDDPLTLEALSYLRCVKEVSEADPLPLRVSRRFPELAGAHAIFRAEDDLRAEVEARVLADQPAAEIAELCGLTAATVEAYESVFFDVRTHLHARNWVLRKAVQGCPAGFPGVPETAVLWKWTAFFGGLLVLDVVMAATGGRSARRYSEALLDLARRFVEITWAPLTPADIRTSRSPKSKTPTGRSQRQGATNRSRMDVRSTPLFPAATESLRPDIAAASPAGRDVTNPEITCNLNAADGDRAHDKKGRGGNPKAA